MYRVTTRSLVWIPLFVVGLITQVSFASTTTTRRVAGAGFHNPFVPPPPGITWPGLSRRSILSSIPSHYTGGGAVVRPIAAAGIRSSSSSTSSSLIEARLRNHQQRRNNLLCAATGSGVSGGVWRGIFSSSSHRGGAAAAASASIPSRSTDKEGSAVYFQPPGTPTDIRGMDVGITHGGERPKATAGATAAGKGKKKVLILMSDTGGGHRASAQALEAAFSELFPNQVSE